jgi:hypothetical protein
MADFNLERLLQKLKGIADSPDIAAAAEGAGSDVWDEGQAVGTDDRFARGQFGVVDPRTGDGMVTRAFQPSAATPPDYPVDVPFIPGTQTWITEMREGGGILRTVAWTAIADLPGACSVAYAGMVAANWVYTHDPAKISRLAAETGGTVLAIFEQSTRIAILLDMGRDDSPPSATYSLLLTELEKPNLKSADNAAV